MVGRRQGKGISIIIQPIYLSQLYFHTANLINLVQCKLYNIYMYYICFEKAYKPNATGC